MNNMRLTIMRRTLKYLLPALVAVILPLSSCIEDSVSTDASMQPTFSVDTLRLGDIFTEQLTPTSRFTVYNRGDNILNIGNISLRDDNAGMYRLNVDGFSGRTFSNVEIRPKDSIFVFVEALIPENPTALPVVINTLLDFTTLGQTKTVVINAHTRNATRLKGISLAADTHLTAEQPYIIYDSLVVEQGATLHLEPGTELYFHDAAYLRVKGCIRSLGTAEKGIEFRGERNGYVASDIPYEIMSGQWGGIILDPTSSGNRMEFTTVKNSEFGIFADHTDLTATNSCFRNSKGYVLHSKGSRISLTGTEIAEAADGLLYLDGGSATLDFCTLSNNYLFSAIGGAAVQLSHIDADSDNGSGEDYLSAEIRNTIIYGIGSDISHGDLAGSNVFLRNCILRSAGSNDDNFIDCLWDTDPLFRTVRAEYYFDYRVREGSPAICAANPQFLTPGATSDRYGNLRRTDAPDLGAYVYVPEE